MTHRACMRGEIYASSSCKRLGEHFSSGACKNSDYVVQIVEKLKGNGRKNNMLDPEITSARCWVSQPISYYFLRGLRGIRGD